MRIVAKWPKGPHWTWHHSGRSSGSTCSCQTGLAAHQETKPPSWTEHQREPRIRMGKNGWTCFFWTWDIRNSWGELKVIFETSAQVNVVHASHQHSSLTKVQRLLRHNIAPCLLCQASQGMGCAGQQIHIVAGSWPWWWWWWYELVVMMMMVMMTMMVLLIWLMVVLTIGDYQMVVNDVFSLTLDMI